jgi:hypothetical protein
MPEPNEMIGSSPMITVTPVLNTKTDVFANYDSVMNNYDELKKEIDKLDSILLTNNTGDFMNWINKVLGLIPFASIWNFIISILPTKTLIGYFMDYIDSMVAKTDNTLDDVGAKVLRVIFEEAGLIDKKP